MVHVYDEGEGDADADGESGLPDGRFEMIAHSRVGQTVWTMKCVRLHLVQPYAGHELCGCTKVFNVALFQFALSYFVFESVGTERLW